MGFFEEAQRQALYKRCGHCGSANVAMNIKEFADCNSAQVHCRTCGMRTRACRFISGDRDSQLRAEAEARNAWNKRVKELI